MRQARTEVLRPIPDVRLNRLKAALKALDRYFGIEVDDALSIAEQVDSEVTRAERFCSARPPAPSPSRAAYAAKRNSRTSSKIRLRAGSGVMHMVRYVSRKGSRKVRSLPAHVPEEGPGAARAFARASDGPSLRRQCAICNLRLVDIWNKT